MIKFKLMKQDNNEQLVDARELWIQLDVKRDFTTWIKGRIERYRFVENVDFMHSLNFPQNGGKLGRPLENYILTLDMAKELAMIENNERGRAVRKYFIQCEKKAKRLRDKANGYFKK